MKLVVVQCADGITTVISEWTDNEQGAIMAWHSQARSLWGESSVKKAVIRILDENLDQWKMYSEIIEHSET